MGGLGGSQTASAVRDTAEGVLGEIVERSHLLHPDDLLPLAREALARVGGVDVGMHAVDYDQASLVPLPASPADAVDPYIIDSTLPGRSYRTSKVVEGEADGGRRLWIPMLDGAERAGVLGVTVPVVHDPLVRLLHHVASLLGEPETPSTTG